MAKKLMNHLNYITQDINQVLINNALTQDKEVFCKKRHAILEPQVDDCKECPYFGGLMQGQGHNCVWEDVHPIEIAEWVVYPADKQKELLRVSKLIDKGYITKY